MDVTAVIRSANPLRREIEGIQTLVHVSRFHDAAGLLKESLAAIEKVKTERFFFLDDADGLPDDYLRVLDLCVQAGTPIAYTNELVNDVLWQGGPYSQDRHIAKPFLIHHLALCKTEAALRAMKLIPRGTYAVEPLLFFQVAKEGAAWVDEVGYLWKRCPSGLSFHPTLTRGAVLASLWNRDHRA